MAVINTGRFNRGLQKALGIKGEVVIPDLDSALQAGYDLSQPQMDTRFLFGWRSYGKADVNAGVANQNSRNFLSNPVGSGIIAVVEKIIVYQLNTFDVSVFLGLIPIVAGTTAGFGRDSRQGTLGTALSISKVGHDTNVGVINSLAQVPQSLIAAAIAVYRPVEGPDDQLVLLPGDTVSITSNSAPVGGVSQIANFWWRERALDPSEVTA